MRALMWLLWAVIGLLGLALAALTIGAYAQMSSGLPLWLRSLGTVEAALGAKIGTFDLPLFVRAALLSVVASAALGLASYLRPRR